MATEQGEYPTIREEIVRTTLDALIWLLDRKDRGLITDQERYVAIQTLSIAVSGYMPPEIFEMLSVDEPDHEERAVG